MTLSGSVTLARLHTLAPTRLHARSLLATTAPSSRSLLMAIALFAALLALHGLASAGAEERLYEDRQLREGGWRGRARRAPGRRLHLRERDVEVRGLEGQPLELPLRHL